ARLLGNRLEWLAPNPLRRPKAPHPHAVAPRLSRVASDNRRRRLGGRPPSTRPPKQTPGARPLSPTLRRACAVGRGTVAFATLAPLGSFVFNLLHAIAAGR